MQPQPHTTASADVRRCTDKIHIQPASNSDRAQEATIAFAPGQPSGTRQRKDHPACQLPRRSAIRPRERTSLSSRAGAAETWAVRPEAPADAEGGAAPPALRRSSLRPACPPPTPARKAPPARWPGRRAGIQRRVVHARRSVQLARPQTQGTSCHRRP